QHGTTVVDNSSQWRMDKDVPLVVPEVNPEDIAANNGIIANPNCSTIQAVVALKPLQDKYGIKRVVYSTYQAVAGSGLKGINDLKNGIEGNDEPLQAYAHQIAYNCLPHIDVFLENGYSKEEMKMVNETHKILHDDNIGVTATTVRVPVYYGHSESINIELEKPFELEDIFELFRNAPGIVLQDDLENNVYPLATEAAGTDPVYVGRIRRDFSVENGINLWCVADNVRKGAATNAIQIAEKLLEVLPD
ncbi:MAG: aspartate-semialdehyde dehydrogenase, partial [Firmicutes bacterium]|nr:aspartate-semialdehyde dehydrogenase [Bacillota bacterium]MDY6174045.1 aspartate-semialdehyde dehydrogenase [Lentihominibacter sp.]